MILLLERDKNGGVLATFTNSCDTREWYFNAPPKSISHVDIGYLRDRFPNVRDRRQADFIKREWSRQMREEDDTDG